MRYRWKRYFLQPVLSILHIKGTIKNFHLEPPPPTTLLQQLTRKRIYTIGLERNGRWLRDQTRLLIDVIRLYFVSGTVVFVFTKGNRAPGNV